MFWKYFYLVICLNIILSVKSQSQYDDYGDYDAEQQIKTGNSYFFISLFVYIYIIIEEPLIFSNRPQSTKVPIGSHAVFYCSSSSSPIIWSKVCVILSKKY